jgi:hypothetical protein
MPANQRFPWVAVSAIVSAGVLTAVTWLQPPGSRKREEALATFPPLGLTQLTPASPTGLLVEQLAAYDPAPLFMPSPMNSSEPPLLGAAGLNANSPFDALVPELTKTGAMKFPSPVTVPANPVDGLRLTERADAPLALARTDPKLKPLGTRVGQIEVVNAASGRVVSVMDLPPASTELPEGEWQPLEMMGAVTRAGLIGDLVITTSSGSVEIDEYFRSHLKRNVRIGDRLSQGFYAFRIGP